MMSSFLVVHALFVFFAEHAFALPSGYNSTNTTSAPSSIITSAPPFTCSNLGIQSNQVKYPFPYIIPYNTTQSCDIFGPICQPGSITLSAAGTDCKLTQTTLPCSSYLTTQSKYLHDFNSPSQPGAQFPWWPSDWVKGFGRSPECRSMEKYYDVPGGKQIKPWDLSQCPAEDRAYPTTVKVPPQFPPGFQRQGGFNWWSCCGNCSLAIPEVRLWYFEDDSKEAKDYCRSVGRDLLGINNGTSRGNGTSPKASPNKLKKRGSGSIAVVSGHTFTSPSVYLEVVGTMSVEDRCGPVGTALANPFITFAPGVLSTYEPQYPVSVGEPVGDNPVEWTFIGKVSPLKIPELECPTFGVGRTTIGGKERLTNGPPWLPWIVPASEAFTLDPTWNSQCQGVWSFGIGLKSFAIYDPPRALVPGEGLKPDPTQPLPAGNTPEAPLKDPPLNPGQAPNPQQPKQTAGAGGMVDPNAGSGGKTDPQQGGGDPAKGGADPAKGGSDPAKGGSDPAKGGSDSAKGGSDSAKGGSDPAKGGSDPAKGGSNTGNGGQAAPNGNGGQASNPSLNNAAGQTNNGGGNQGSPAAAGNQGGGSNPGALSGAGGAPSLGQAIMNGFGPSQGQSGAGSGSPAVQPAAQAAPAPQPITVGGQTFTPDPNGFKVGGNDIKPGGPAVTVAGTPIALGQGGALAIGSSTINVAPAPSPAPQPVRIGGQNVIPNAAGFQVGGQQVNPGGPPVSVAGTPVSLGTAGNLVIGSSTIPIGAVASPGYQILSAGGQTFTPNPTGFVVAGQAVKPGGSAATVGGTAISLGNNGQLAVGSATISLAPAANPTLTIGDQKITANAGGFVIAGTTMTPGGAAATVSGTVVSLGPSGQLKIGSQTIALPTASASVPNVITVNGRPVTASPSGFQLDGSSVVPGGSAVVVAGTSVSLGTDGVLTVGGSKTSLTRATGSSGPATYLGNAAGRLTISSWCMLVTAIAVSMLVMR